MFFVFCILRKQSIILFQMQDRFAVMTQLYRHIKQFQYGYRNDLKFSTSHYKRYTIKLINIKGTFGI